MSSSRSSSGRSFKSALDFAQSKANEAVGAEAGVLRLEPDAESVPQYSSREVLDLLGVKPREVRQWLGPAQPGGLRAADPLAGRAGLESPSASSDQASRHEAHSAARYSVNDVQLLRSAKELRRGQVPARKIRAAFASLKRRLPAGNSPMALRLVAEGKKVVVRDGDGTWDAESGQLLFDFASTHSLWPLDVAVPEQQASGELRYTKGGVPAPPVGKVLPFTDRRSREESAQVWYQKARELELAGDGGAVAAYRQALRIDPHMVDAQIDLGRLLHERGDLKQARVHYELALEAEPGSSTASFNRAVVLEDLGHHEQAVEAYTDTLALDPMHADAYYNLARLYEVRGDRAAALRCLQSYRRLNRALD